MDQENQNKQNQENETLLWCNESGEQSQEFEELAGINKRTMEGIIQEIQEGEQSASEQSAPVEDQFNSTPSAVAEEAESQLFNQDEIQRLPQQDNTNNEKIKSEEDAPFDFGKNNVEGEAEESDKETDEYIFSEKSDFDNQEEALISQQEDDEAVFISKRKLNLIQKLTANILENSRRLEDLLAGGEGEEDMRSLGQPGLLEAEDEEELKNELGAKVIEGVFNGQCMIGPDGKQYNVPSNYASKSKLVEGDILKLTINSLGKFIYKQIGPIERDRIVGILSIGKNSQYYVENNGRKWKILMASVTYFKGKSGDETVILVPKQGDSNWAAVENIVNKP